MAIQTPQCRKAASASPLRVKQTRRGVIFRAALVALVAAVLVLGGYGERWLLAQSPAAPNEWTFATCVLNADGAPGPVNLCSGIAR